MIPVIVPGCHRKSRKIFYIDFSSLEHSAVCDLRSIAALLDFIPSDILCSFLGKHLRKIFKYYRFCFHFDINV